MRRLIPRFWRRKNVKSEPSRWTGSLDLAEEVAFHLHDDIYSLQQLALTSYVFRQAAQKVLFKSLKWLDDYTIHNWQLWLHEFAVIHGTRALPSVLRFVKKLSFSLETFHVQSRTVIGLISYVQPGLTGLESIQVFGNDGLLCLHPGCSWFSTFIMKTQPTILSFHGALIPGYILDFSYPSVKILEFNACRIHYFETDAPSDLPKQPSLDARLILSRHGENWDRVEELVSTALNSETLRLIQGAKKLDALGFRVVFNALRATADMELNRNITQVRSLCLQVPSASMTLIPGFIQDIVLKAPYLEEIDIFFENGWEEISSWQKIMRQGADAIFGAVYKLSVLRLRAVYFRFEVAASNPNLHRTLDISKHDGIYVRAKFDDNIPLCAPRMSSKVFFEPFLLSYSRKFSE